MMRAALLSSVLSLLCGCPAKERHEAIEQVGGAPKRQLDDVQRRVDAAGAKDQAAQDRAAKAAEDP